MDGERHIVMGQCEGRCGLVVPAETLHRCDCPCHKMMTIACLADHAKKLHLNAYHLKQLGGRK